MPTSHSLLRDPDCVPQNPSACWRSGAGGGRFPRLNILMVLASFWERQMHFHGKSYRLSVLAAGVALGVLVSGSAQALNFSFRFSGSMSCMRPVPVSNAPISGSGTGVLNPDGSVTAQITQSLAIFSTSLQFDSKLGPRVTPVPGGTGRCV